MTSPGRDKPSITAYPDGPLIVRGDVDLVDSAGRTIDRARRTLALCRCGVSAIEPFCDGTHKLVGFRTADEPAPSHAGAAAGADATEGRGRSDELPLVQD